MDNSNRIWKYLQQELTEPESQLFRQWLEASAENRLEFEYLKTIWEQSEAIRHSIQVDEKSAWSEFSEKISEQPRKTRPFIRFTGIAASLLLIGSFVVWLLIKLEPEPLYAEYSTQNEPAVFLLADSSLITLDPDSYIRYYTRIDADMKERTLFVRGRGTFDVAHDSVRPFIVEVEPAGVEVLGTRFRVDQKDSNEVEVENYSGLIRFFELSDRDNAVLVSPGETFTFSDGGFLDKTVREVVIPEESGENLTIEQILDQLFLKFDGRFNTGPYGKFDMKGVVRIDLNQSLDTIMAELNRKTSMVYRKTCPDCYEVRSLEVIE
jgi:ferric-dicitrate binding protein FerR (iron transport regulator)